MATQPGNAVWARCLPGWLGLADNALARSDWDALEHAAQQVEGFPGCQLAAELLRARGFINRRDFAAANPAAVDGVCRAIIEAYGFIFNKDKKQAVKESIARNLRLPKVDAAEDFYQEALEELDRKPYPSLEGTRIVIKYVAEQNPKAGAIKVEDLVDTSWLKKLDGEGFFEKVYEREVLSRVRNARMNSCK